MSLLRTIVLATATVALIYYGLQGAHGTLTGLLVLIGACATTIWWANIWKQD